MNTKRSPALLASILLGAAAHAQSAPSTPSVTATLAGSVAVSPPTWTPTNDTIMGQPALKIATGTGSEGGSSSVAATVLWTVTLTYVQGPNDPAPPTHLSFTYDEYSQTDAYGSTHAAGTGPSGIVANAEGKSYTLDSIVRLMQQADAVSEEDPAPDPNTGAPRPNAKKQSGGGDLYFSGQNGWTPMSSGTNDGSKTYTYSFQLTQTNFSAHTSMQAGPDGDPLRDEDSSSASGANGVVNFVMSGITY